MNDIFFKLLPIEFKIKSSVMSRAKELNKSFLEMNNLFFLLDDPKERIFLSITAYDTYIHGSLQ